MPENQKGPQLELSLAGVARDLVREISLQVKVDGAAYDLGDGNGPQFFTGAAFILQGWAQRFMPLDDEQNFRAVADPHGFARWPGESIDAFLTRWEVVVQRARTRGGLNVSFQHSAWMFFLST